MKEANIKIFKNPIRQRRAISSNILENGNCNESREERNKSNNGIKTFHRKTTTSYFYGSYLSSNLENDLLNNLNIDEINNKFKDNESYALNEKEKNKILDTVNKMNTINNNIEDNINISFHSYELDDNNNIIKSEEKSNNINNSNKNNNNSKTNIKNGQNIIVNNNKNNDKLLLNEKEKKN